LPHALILPLLHAANWELNFVKCVEDCIMTSGCVASRASIAGACVSALGSDSSVPEEWIRLSSKAQHASTLVDKLMGIREEKSRL